VHRLVRAEQDHPARLAAALGGGRGAHGPDQLPHAIGDLHDDLLWSRPRPLRPCGPGWPASVCGVDLGVSADRVRGVAALLRRGAGGMADPLARVQTAADLPARFTRRRRWPILSSARCPRRSGGRVC
jgi:hypothetical protein